MKKGKGFIIAIILGVLVVSNLFFVTAFIVCKDRNKELYIETLELKMSAQRSSDYERAEKYLKTLGRTYYLSEQDNTLVITLECDSFEMMNLSESNFFSKLGEGVYADKYRCYIINLKNSSGVYYTGYIYTDGTSNKTDYIFWAQ